MSVRRPWIIAGTLAAVTIALGVAQNSLSASLRQQTVQAPAFEVDPVWPKPLPNHWILGSTIGVGVDARDHVFIIHRGDSTLTMRTEAGLDTDPSAANTGAVQITS